MPNETLVFENGERVFPCRCGETHRGPYAEYDYGHHNCMHTAKLVAISEPYHWMCPQCGKNFWLAEVRPVADAEALALALEEIADGYERHNPGWWIKRAKLALSKYRNGVVADALPLEGHLKDAIEALRNYGRHHPRCAYRLDYTAACDCGWRAIAARFRLGEVGGGGAALPGEHNTPETASNADADASGRASGAA